MKAFYTLTLLMRGAIADIKRPRSSGVRDYVSRTFTERPPDASLASAFLGVTVFQGTPSVSRGFENAVSFHQ